MSPEREIRHLTVTVDGDERDATWKQGVGIYVEGVDFGKGDTVLIERGRCTRWSRCGGCSCREKRWTLIIAARRE